MNDMQDPVLNSKNAKYLVLLLALLVFHLVNNLIVLGNDNTPLLWDGVYEYSYTARATTPGHFVVPPAKAEEMYSPEVFGRSGSDVVVVE